MLHELELVVAYFGVFADTAQVIADDGQIVFARIDFLDTANTFDGTLFQSVTADGVHRIRRIDDQSAIVQDVGYPLQVLRVVVFIIQLQKHNLFSFLLFDFLQEFQSFLSGLFCNLLFDRIFVCSGCRVESQLFS